MLKVIPSRPDYDDWLKIASAVWDAVPMAEGCQLLNEWSPEEQEGEYASKHKSRLKEIGIATLIYLAKENGWKPKKGGRVIMGKKKAAEQEETDFDSSIIDRIFYAGKGGFALEHEGNYIPLPNEGPVRQHLLAVGCPKDNVSPTLCEIRLKNFVQYIGPVAGLTPGIHISDDSGRRILVTDGPTIIQGVEGSFDFVIEFLLELFGKGDQTEAAVAWIRQARRNVIEGKRRPLPAATLVGPKSCGKTLFLEVVRLCLGGRSASAFAALSGVNGFNADVIGAELLTVDDEIASRDHRARTAFAQGLKKYLFAGNVRVEGKFREAVTLRPVFAVGIAVNDEAEHLQVLPAMDDSLSDKISLFDCTHASLNGLDDRDEIIAKIRGELPGFVHFLDTSDHPENLRDKRTGARAWQSPRILELLNGLSPESRFLELVRQCDAVRGAVVTQGYWKGTAADLERVLLDDPNTRHAARSLLNFPGAGGTFMGRLQASGRGGVSGALSRGLTKWTVTEVVDHGGPCFSPNNVRD